MTGSLFEYSMEKGGYKISGGVGNSYAFNWYMRDLKSASIPDHSRLILFTEAPVVDNFSENFWHRGKANTCFLDGHLEYIVVPNQSETDPLWWR